MSDDWGIMEKTGFGTLNEQGLKHLSPQGGKAKNQSPMERHKKINSLIQARESIAMSQVHKEHRNE